MSTPPDNLTGEQQACRLRRLNICATNQLFPTEGRTSCYCYAIELSDADGLAHLSEGFRLSRAVALMHIRKAPEFFGDLDGNDQET